MRSLRHACVALSMGASGGDDLEVLSYHDLHPKQDELPIAPPYGLQLSKYLSRPLAAGNGFATDHHSPAQGAFQEQPRPQCCPKTRPPAPPKLRDACESGQQDGKHNIKQWLYGTRSPWRCREATSTDLRIDRNGTLALGPNLHSRCLDRCRFESRDQRDQRRCTFPRALGLQGTLNNCDDAADGMAHMQ